MKTETKQEEKILKYKLLYTGLVFLMYIFGKNIPLYRVDMSEYRHEAVQAGELMVRMVGGDAYQCSVFALGIFPFMISELLIQVVMAVRNTFFETSVSPRLVGRVSVALTFVVAVLQALDQIQKLKFSPAGEVLGVVKTMAGVEMVAGVMLILWLSGQNARYGVGGRMAFGLVNILDRIISIIMKYDMQKLMLPLMIALVMVVVTVIMENAEMRIPVQRVSIHNIYADKNYMAIKLNPVGVMPMMFTSAVFMLPQLLLSLVALYFPKHAWVLWWTQNMTLTKPFGIAVYVVCEYLLTVGLAMLTISPKNIAEQFLKSGDSIVDIHAGDDTRRYLRRTVWNISFFSATVMGVFVAVPLILQMKGKADGILAMLPISVMMMTGFCCNIFREIISIRKYDSCQPLF